jgi:hypothetical protein
MLRRVLPLALLACLALVLVTSAAALTKPQAIAIVRALLEKRAASCDIANIYSLSATAPTLDRVRVTGRIKQGGFNTNVIFWVAGNKKITAGGPLEADLVAGRC